MPITSTREAIESEREGDLIKTWPHPRTGEPIPYADERILTIPQLTAGMREAGFRIGEVEVFVPGQSSPPEWLWRILFLDAFAIVLLYLLGRQILQRITG